VALTFKSRSIEGAFEFTVPMSHADFTDLVGKGMAYLLDSADPGSEFAPINSSPDPRDPRPGDRFPNVGYVRHITGNDPVLASA
jgi:hypothetical protein